ncbi:hypothetical protein GF382_03040 [Candidatus Falkowbacteria bacterium]|nr:hypothetical protein [Candidatus Falkowbacteria bacterium]
MIKPIIRRKNPPFEIKDSKRRENLNKILRDCRYKKIIPSDVKTFFIRTAEKNKDDFLWSEASETEKDLYLRTGDTSFADNPEITEGE